MSKKHLKIYIELREIEIEIEKLEKELLSIILLQELVD